MTKIMIFVCFVTLFLVVCHGYKILLVFPNTGRSHTILADGYVDSLLEAGHEVTLITPYPKENPAPNVTQIDVSGNVELHFGQFVALEKIMNGTSVPSKYNSFNVMYNIARRTIENEGVKRLLQDPKQRFDVVIAEWLFSDFYAGLAAVFDCPFIWAGSMNPSWLMLQLVDALEAARNPEYFPDMQTRNSPPFSHAVRLQEFSHQVKVLAMKKFIFHGYEKQLYEANIVPILKSRGRYVADFEQVVWNASLILMNSHAFLAQSMPLPPNCVTIGGYHIDSKIPPLPATLQTLMDEASDGVICFSMGTNLSSETFPESTIRGLLKMFSELKLLVLWKYREELTDLPDNVHILPWVPQQGILSHPNCVLFITHGGYLSITEAVHFGVPLITIPVFADQFANAAKVQRRGIGKIVDLTFNLAGDLKTAIAEIISNQRYKEKVKQLSSMYHDQKSPRRRLVGWVDYVVRTRGAVHLRSPSALVPWYQQVYIDLLLLLLVAIIVVICITRTLLRCMFP